MPSWANGGALSLFFLPFLHALLSAGPIVAQLSSSLSQAPSSGFRAISTHSNTSQCYYTLLAKSLYKLQTCRAFPHSPHQSKLKKTVGECAPSAVKADQVATWTASTLV